MDDAITSIYELLDAIEAVINPRAPSWWGERPRGCRAGIHHAARAQRRLCAAS